MLHRTPRILRGLFLITSTLAWVASAQNNNKSNQQQVGLAFSGGLVDEGNSLEVRIKTQSGREWYDAYGFGRSDGVSDFIVTTEVSTNGCSSVTIGSLEAFSAADVRIDYERIHDVKGPFDTTQSIENIGDMPYVLVALLGNGCPQPTCPEDEILVELEAVAFSPRFSLTGSLNGEETVGLGLALDSSANPTYSYASGSTIGSSYGYQHACLPKNGCYRFSQEDAWGQYDTNLFNVTIDGQRLQAFPDGYLQTHEFGASCGCELDQVPLDLYVHIDSGSNSWKKWTRDDEEDPQKLVPVVDMTWVLRDASGQGKFDGRSGTVGYQEGLQNDNFHRICVPRNSCHRLGLSVPETFGYDSIEKQRSFNLKGSYTVVLEGIIYGSHAFEFGTVSYPGPAYDPVFDDSTLVGSGCSAAACSPEESFLDVGFATIPEFPGGACSSFEDRGSEEWTLETKWLEPRGSTPPYDWVTHKSYSQPLVYQSYDCLEFSDRACVIMHRWRHVCDPTGVFAVSLDGTPIEEWTNGPDEDGYPDRDYFDGAFHLFRDERAGELCKDPFATAPNNEATTESSDAARGSLVALPLGASIGWMMAILWS